MGGDTGTKPQHGECKASTAAGPHTHTHTPVVFPPQVCSGERPGGVRSPG